MAVSDRKTWRIVGRKRLNGRVAVHGNKNAALPAMTASLLLPRTGNELVLTNIPRIRDVMVLTDILAHLGISSSWDGTDTLRLKRVRMFNRMPDLPREVVSRIRGSIVLLGPLSGLWKEFTLPKPGGDKIGTRPITAHTSALADLGVRVSDRSGVLTVSRAIDPGTAGSLQVWLTEQSVTATETVLLHSAFLGRKQSLTVNGAATEPHIVTLCRVLSAMGARISGTGSSVLNISWPRGRTRPVRPVRCDDDFMEATTLAVAAAVSRGNVDIVFRNPGSLELIDRYLRWMGVRTDILPEKNMWRIHGARSTLRLNSRLGVIKAEPWPRLPTDVMSAMVVLATQCRGTVKFLEYMYDDRFGFAQMLQDMGATIRTEGPHVISVSGPTPLAGNEMLLRPDIRSGAAMLLAALAASGTSLLHDRRGVIARGYQDLAASLKGLGADITEVSGLFADSSQD
ncbi:MAG TPA: UDP-N-acetylglucosamine 1-carboxyvinyltransferase [Candidatus Paceibacterota bacterium]|nr:UDP-N-acetylglucosamine 1-carboxyvinyltransferase [Candidatus Paceibacterota bacterium]